MTQQENIGEDVVEYERLKHEEKRIKDRIEKLGKSITIFMQQEGADVTPELPLGGKIYLKNKISYEYSIDLQVEEDKIKEMKKHEELNNTATKNETFHIEYRRPR